MISVLLLIGQLAWPSAVHWWRLPGSGTVGFDQFDSPTMARDYLIYLPETYRGTKAWPLVVFLHGSGERGTEPNRLRKIGPIPLKLPAIVAVPQCLPSNSWDPDTVAALAEHVASHFKVNRKRIYLVGYSMGGSGVWLTASAHPNFFAAIVPIAGGGNPEDAKRLQDLPIWAFHGESDKVVPVKESKAMVEVVRTAGGPAKLTIIAGAGHGICNSVCGRPDLWQWLFEQRRLH